MDQAAVEVDLHLVAVLDGFGGLGAFDDRKADVDGVPVKDAGEGLCDHTAYAGAFDGERRMLSRRTAAEVFLADDDVALLYLMDEFLVDVLHAVLCQLFALGRV